MNLSPIISQAPIPGVPLYPAVRRGTPAAQVTAPGVPTGVITEIHVERAGIGELQLVMPAAARLTQAGRWLVMIAPPGLHHAPNAVALAAHGVDLSRLMLVRPHTLAEQLWTCEQALLSDNGGSVMLWLDQSSARIPENALRRLQLAAERRNVLVLLFRASRAARRRAKSSPA